MALVVKSFCVIVGRETACSHTVDVCDMYFQVKQTGCVHVDNWTMMPFYLHIMRLFQCIPFLELFMFHIFSANEPVSPHYSGDTF